jgi:cell surface protein SprA
LSNDNEGSVYTNFIGIDPAADDYTFYLEHRWRDFERYKNYNGIDGNSAVDITDPNRGSSTAPDVEDITETIR